MVLCTCSYDFRGEKMNEDKSKKTIAAELADLVKKAGYKPILKGKVESVISKSGNFLKMIEAETDSDKYTIVDIYADDEDDFYKTLKEYGIEESWVVASYADADQDGYNVTVRIVIPEGKNIKHPEHIELIDKEYFERYLDELGQWPEM